MGCVSENNPVQACQIDDVRWEVFRHPHPRIFGNGEMLLFERRGRMGGVACWLVGGLCGLTVVQDCYTGRRT